jgi:GNAT superfamily N-acetyltransferase
MDWSLRLATDDDIPALESLIGRSVRELQADSYSSAQMDGALGSVFGVDRQLIRDQTYFVIEQAGAIVACGGWSKRESLFGSDAARAKEDALLDPPTQPARIRAFFVHPGHARRGLGRAILLACESAIREAGFRTVTLVATLPGVAFYEAFGYKSGQGYEVPLVNGLSLAVVPMTRSLAVSHE